MFGWFKKKKEEREDPLSLPEEEQEEYVAHATWKITIDGDIWLDFSWNNDKNPDAAKMFAQTFVMITGGELIEESLEFIREKMMEEGRDEQYESLLTYIASLQYQRAEKLYPEILSSMQEVSDGKGLDPVVKPSEIVTQTTAFKHSGL